jgi:hypothetical protein
MLGSLVRFPLGVLLFGDSHTVAFVRKANGLLFLLSVVLRSTSGSAVLPQYSYFASGSKSRFENLVKKRWFFIFISPSQKRDSLWRACRLSMITQVCD